VRIGMESSQQHMPWSGVVERARYAESAGFDGFWLFDHLKAMYGDPTGPCFEAWTTMAALAAITQHIRLATLVTGMTYRHPSILASEVVTIDHVSNGRVELAVGAAWFEEEHRELGIPFPGVRERAERLEEGVQVMRLLMTQDHTTFDGRHFQLSDATYRPRPVQQPHPPIWIGAHGEKLMLPIVARQADWWHSGGPVEELIRKSRLLDRLAEESGRDPASIARATNLDLSSPWDELRRSANALREAGYSYFIAGWPSEGQERMDYFVENIMPELQKL
jgi:F420-dependent oxidoreductase-like protein